MDFNLGDDDDNHHFSRSITLSFLHSEMEIKLSSKQLRKRDQQSSLPETPFTARIRRRGTFHFRLLRDTRILSFVSRQLVPTEKMEKSTREGKKQIARNGEKQQRVEKRLAALETFHPFDFGNTVNSLWANLHSLLNGHCFTLARKDIPPSD